MINFLNKILRKKSLELSGYPNKDIRRRLKIMKMANINLLLDVGANEGQYGKKSREYGYKGKIISFEPSSLAFKKLLLNSNKDENWKVFNYGLGENNRKTKINIAGNSQSSSILEMHKTHLESRPSSTYISSEEIEIVSLDSILPQLANENDNIMMKIDTQGYEKFVLEGADRSLGKIKVIQIEMSLSNLYINEMPFVEKIIYLNEKGFQLFSIENGFSDKNKPQLLCVDGIFIKKN
jgi:FkbM family methyltransferase